MNLRKRYYNNTRKPVGWMGQRMVAQMNVGHGAVSDWAMAKLEGLDPVSIAELGCGGGRNVQQLLMKFPGATVTGLDYSAVSVKKARQINRAEIQSHRCQILNGDVSNLSLPSESFDLATAFETVYFWPGPLESFQEVYRILKPGGRFMIVNDTDGTKEIDQEWVKMINGMQLYTEYQLEDHLKAAGFLEVSVTKDPIKRWICLIGTK